MNKSNLPVRYFTSGDSSENSSKDGRDYGNQNRGGHLIFVYKKYILLFLKEKEVTLPTVIVR